MTSLGRELAGDLPRAAIEGLAGGETFRLVVAGRSMAPVLVEGDELVAVRTAGGRGWKLGDIVVLDLPGAGLVVHRVVWSSAGSVRTRGDGSGLVDAPVTPERVLGRVVSATRAGRDVTENGLRRRASWLRGLAAAAWRRLWRDALGT